MSMQPNAAQAAAQKARDAQIANGNARALIVSRAFPMFQSIYSATIQPATQVTVNVAPQNVGLIKGFLIRMTALVTNPASGSTTLTLTALGPANLVQSFLFTDLQNYQRINTTGWHIAMLNAARQGRPFLSSTASDSPTGFGSNWTVIKAPSTIAANNTGTIYMYYWIPLSYTDTDLTGAIYANVVNATLNLQINLSTAAQAVVANTADPTLAIYQGAGAVAGVTLTNVTINVYQSYYDQLPMGDQGPILPVIDLNTIYELKNTALGSLVAAQDFNVPYSNFRHFLSTCLFYNNQVTGVPNATPGSDINFFSFRTANYTDARKADPFTWAALARRKILTDFPSNMYYFDHRDKPIYTTQVGNTNLVINPITVNTNASVLVGYEMLANINNLQNAGALSS